MSIRTCNLISRAGREQLTGGKRVVTFTSRWRSISTTRNENPSIVLADVRLPGLATGWDTFPGSLCVSRTPEQQGVGREEEWITTLEYTTHPDIGRGEDPEQVHENPLMRPCIIDRKNQARQRIIERDAYDQYVKNTAGERPIPPWERDEHPPSFSLKKNLSSWPTTFELAFADSINLTALSYPMRQIIYPEKTLKFNGFTGGDRWENGYKFQEVTADFESDWQGWNKPLVNAGYNEVCEVDESLLWPIIGANGERPAEPVLLDEDGFADPYRTTPVLLDYRKHRELEWAPLMALFGLT